MHVRRYLLTRGLALGAERLTLSARGLALSAERLTLSAGRLALSAGRLALSAGRLTLSAEWLALNARRLALDARRHALDAGQLTLDARRLALDARWLTLDAGLVFCQESGHDTMSVYFQKPTALRLVYFRKRAVKKTTALPRKLRVVVERFSPFQSDRPSHNRSVIHSSKWNGFVFHYRKR